MKKSLSTKTPAFNRVCVLGLGYVGLPMAAIMATRGIEVPEALRDRVLACTDVTTLDVWLARAVTATSAGEVVGE